MATQQQNPAVYRHLALAHLNLNEVDQALQALEEARRLQPNNRVWPAIIEILAQRSVKNNVSEAIVIPALRELRPAAVLVVDDSPLQARFVSGVLEKRGWQVLTASCGEEALRKAEEAGVILLDVFMPGMDGYSVCQRLKENPATVSIPVVMLSGQDVTIDKDRARQVGAADYLTKPCAADVLLRVVEQYGSPMRS
jgi:CheY-like chemotaxis protein